MSDNFSVFAGGIPENYDRGLGPHIFVDYAADMAARAVALAPPRVLELACGTGIVTRMLRDLLPRNTNLTATDLNAPMLAVAGQKFTYKEQIQLRPADAAELPFPDGAFNCLVCQFGVMFFPDKEMSYREAHRVLRPGGTYLLSVWDSMDANPFARIAYEAIAGFFDDDPPGFYKLPFHYFDRPAIANALIRSGFKEVTVHDVKLEKEIPSPAAFAHGLVHGNPVIEELRDRGPEFVDQAVEAVTAALKAEFGDPGTMPLSAIVFEAKKG